MDEREIKKRAENVPFIDTFEFGDEKTKLVFLSVGAAMLMKCIEKADEADEKEMVFGTTLGALLLKLKDLPIGSSLQVEPGGEEAMIHTILFALDELGIDYGNGNDGKGTGSGEVYEAIH